MLNASQDIEGCFIYNGSGVYKTQEEEMDKSLLASVLSLTFSSRPRAIGAQSPIRAPMGIQGHELRMCSSLSILAHLSFSNQQGTI